MGTLKPGSHHEVLRSVCPRVCGPCPPRRRRRCRRPPRLRTPIRSPSRPWVCPSIRRSPRRICPRPSCLQRPRLRTFLPFLPFPFLSAPFLPSSHPPFLPSFPFLPFPFLSFPFL